MQIINQMGKIFSAIALLFFLASCGSGENTSSSTMSTDSASTNMAPVNNAMDTTVTETQGGMATPASDNANMAGTRNSNANGNSDKSATMNSGNNSQGSHGAPETNDKGISTGLQVGPHATTVLRGEQNGGTPRGVKKGRGYIPRDSINNRTGLAPPK